MGTFRSLAHQTFFIGAHHAQLEAQSFATDTFPSPFLASCVVFMDFLQSCLKFQWYLHHHLLHPMLRRRPGVTFGGCSALEDGQQVLLVGLPPRSLLGVAGLR